jgi:hypothetical protein
VPAEVEQVRRSASATVACDERVLVGGAVTVSQGRSGACGHDAAAAALPQLLAGTQQRLLQAHRRMRHCSSGCSALADACSWAADQVSGCADACGVFAAAAGRALATGDPACGAVVGSQAFAGRLRRLLSLQRAFAGPLQRLLPSQRALVGPVWRLRCRLRGGRLRSVWFVRGAGAERGEAAVRRWGYARRVRARRWRISVAVRLASAMLRSIASSAALSASFWASAWACVRSRSSASLS